MRTIKERQRKAILILKKIKGKKLESFEKYLLQVCHPENPPSKLFGLLKKSHPSFKNYNNEIAKMQLFEISTDKDLDKQLHKAFETLHKHLLNFISMDYLKKDKSRMADYILDFFHDNQMVLQFERSFKTKSNVLNQEPLRDESYHHQINKLYEKKYFNTWQNKFRNEHKKTDEQNPINLSKAIQHSEISFMLNRLKLTTEQLHRTRIFKEERPVEQFDFLIAILKQAQKNNYYDSPMLEIYAWLVGQFFKNDIVLDKKLNEIIQLFAAHHSCVYAKEQSQILRYLSNEINYQIRNAKIEDGQNLLYQVYKFGLEKKCLQVLDCLDVVSFTNVVLILAKRKDFLEAKKFIANYQHRLPKKWKQEAVRFAEGCISFYGKNYVLAHHQFTQKEKFSNLDLEHRAKTLLLCCQYELLISHKLTCAPNHLPEEQMAQHILNFEQYYERKTDEIADNKSAPYLNFAEAIKELLRLKFASKNILNKEKHNLVNLVTSSSSVAVRGWLLAHARTL
ncbi:MAG: hypothetical protein AAF573_21115 [Bacteroidota bacterium]